MKKTILTFGLISGAISALLMGATVPLSDRIGFDKGEIAGYTIIVLSFLLVFFGIRSYRDNVGGGVVSFGRAFTVGILITLISCVCYVAAWEFIYYNFFPGFMDKYGAYLVEKARASGASPAALQAQLDQVAHYKQLYANPITNAALTFLEPFPIGLLITVLSAAILRRKPHPGAEPASLTAEG